MLASADQQGKPMLARNRQRDSQGENNAATAGYNKTVYFSFTLAVVATANLQ